MNKLTLYFNNSLGFRRIIGTGETEQEIIKMIYQFLKDHNFKSYYIRSWINPENSTEKTYDVGSHSEFFICSNADGWGQGELK